MSFNPRVQGAFTRNGRRFRNIVIATTGAAVLVDSTTTFASAQTGAAAAGTGTGCADYPSLYSDMPPEAIPIDIFKKKVKGKGTGFCAKATVPTDPTKPTPSKLVVKLWAWCPDGDRHYSIKRIRTKTVPNTHVATVRLPPGPCRYPNASAEASWEDLPAPS